MSKILVIVDMQKDFLTGALGNADCESKVTEVIDVVNSGEYDSVILTRDTHQNNYMETQEGRKLPVPHCIEGSDGWLVDSSIVAAVNAKFAADKICYLDKPSFGCIGIKDILDKLGAAAASEISFVGVCTGICVISNVLITKAAFPEVKVSVIERACACVTPDSHKTAIEAMKTCQVDVI